MQFCYEYFAKRFETASDSGSFENVGRELLPDALDGSSTLAGERTHLTFLSHGVGACGRRPSESADPWVRRAGTLGKNSSKRTVYFKNSLVKVL